jgi:hypothetical protein
MRDWARPPAADWAILAASHCFGVLTEPTSLPPTGGAITWMIGWALLGYIFAPYGMWKHTALRHGKRI